jgi:hypothetical protein
MCCAVVSILVGCGSTTPATTAQAPTKAQYIARADAICTAHEQKVKRAIVESYKAPRSGAQVALHEEYAASRLTDGQLAAVPVPAGSSRVLLEWLHWRDLATTDSATTAEFSAAQKATARANSLARAYGFKVCDHSVV